MMNPLSRADIASLNGILAQSTPEEVSDYAGRMVSNMGEDRTALAFDQIGMTKAGAVLGVVGNLSMQGHDEAAGLVLSGFQSDDDTIIPKKADYIEEIQGVKQAFALLGGIAENREKAIKSAYAGIMIRDGDYSGVYDSDSMEEAIDIVVGEPLEYRGSFIMSPNFDTSADDLEDWLDDLSADDLHGLGSSKLYDHDRDLADAIADGDVTLTETGVRGEYYVINGFNFLQKKDEEQPFILKYNR
ncbi:hypothetical protein [Solemya elarraichensis gill symbiont]|nr:hypothetical protein [Solemya elarraichensis gill symbiont]